MQDAPSMTCGRQNGRMQKSAQKIVINYESTMATFDISPGSYRENII